MNDAKVIPQADGGRIFVTKIRTEQGELYVIEQHSAAHEVRFFEATPDEVDDLAGAIVALRSTSTGPREEAAPPGAETCPACLHRAHPKQPCGNITLGQEEGRRFRRPCYCDGASVTGRIWKAPPTSTPAARVADTPPPLAAIVVRGSAQRRPQR